VSGRRLLERLQHASHAFAHKLLSVGTLPGKALAGVSPSAPKALGLTLDRPVVSYFSSRSARYPLGGDIEEPRKADC
jgi:hypothetical protein